jgi:hypothetical protein
MEETKREKPPCKTKRHNGPASSMRVIQLIHRSPWKTGINLNIGLSCLLWFPFSVMKIGNHIKTDQEY